MIDYTKRTAPEPRIDYVHPNRTRRTAAPAPRRPIQLRAGQTINLSQLAR